MSIHTSKPGVRNSVRLLSLFNSLWLVFLLLADCLGASNAYGFTLTRIGFGSTTRLRADDIVQAGGNLGSGAEQVFNQGTLNANLNDFSQPLDVQISGALNGSMTASIDRFVAFMVRLSNSERQRCISDGDLNINLQITDPVADGFIALDPSGGQLQVVNFTPRYRGARGRNCPSTLFYGYALDVGVSGAVAAGTYEGNAQITVDLSGPGGSTEVIQTPLRIEMPGLLLLYHHGQINVNLQASALAGALGASAACSGGYCLGVGRRTLSVNTLGAPIALNIRSAVPLFDPLQTITLRDAIGVKATGCSSNLYATATFQVVNPIGGIQSGNGVIQGIQSQACGLGMRTGDLSFDLDLTQTNATTARASATIQITVTGL